MERPISITPDDATAGRETSRTWSITYLLRYVVILLQILLLAWLIRRYSVEPGFGLGKFMPVLVGGFVVHSLLPRAWQRPFFLLLGLGTTTWLLGGTGSLLFFAGFAILFGILQLPVPVGLRALILGLAALALAAVWGLYPTILPETHRWMPILGSLFMFRATVYLYDVQHEKQSAPLTDRLAYFLMLPNLIFTLFPVVDYKLFRRSSFPRPALDIYQKGIRWMIRGFFHLMLYRIIYYYLQPPLDTVNDLATLFWFSVSSYLLILRLSGIFHFCVGSLCLFGFDLPRVFHNYFLASGFSDLWRRINIYWRDYVVKVFYYPIYFKTRQLGRQTGTVLAILIVFGLTWFLHSYQWFWIRGNFPLRLVDGIFWGIFGIAVAANAVYQQSGSTRKKSSSRTSPWLRSSERGVKITGMLLFMSVLWTFWNSPTVGHWWQLLGPAREATPGEWLQLLLWITGGCFLLVVGLRIFTLPRIRQFLEPAETGRLSVFWGTTTLVLFSLLSFPGILDQFQRFTEKPVRHLYESRLTAADDARRVQGYYEDILLSSNALAPLAEETRGPILGVNFSKSEAAQKTDDWRQVEFKPSVSVPFKGVPLSTNSMGMRDREYAREKPVGHFRVAVLGGSYAMGSGVRNEEVFDAVVEEQLNQARGQKPVYELLNFGVPGYYLPHSAWQFDHLALELDPDLVLLFSHGLDYEKTFRTIAGSFMSGKLIEAPYLRAVTDSAGLREKHLPEFSKAELQQFSKELVTAYLQHIATTCRERGIIPAFAYWPRTAAHLNPPEADEILQLARAAGFRTLDLRPVYQGYSREQLAVAVNDGHPNALGHRLIADEIARFLREIAE